MSKRIVFASDFHCGHQAGLTPPQWRIVHEHPARQKAVEMQSEVWHHFASHIDALRPIDLLVVNGDLIDGKGARTGGTEGYELDRIKQAQMAADCIKFVNAKETRLIYGTPYHVGTEEDMEDVVAQILGVPIEGHGWYSINGTIFDVAHFVSSSAIPHGRHTSIARDALWNKLWAIDGAQPEADVLIRSHVHYYAYNGDAETLAMTLPGLQGFGSKFGIRLCRGKVHIGFVHFDVEDDGSFIFLPHIMKSKVLFASAEVLCN